MGKRAGGLKPVTCVILPIVQLRVQSQASTAMDQARNSRFSHPGFDFGSEINLRDQIWGAASKLEYLGWAASRRKMLVSHGEGGGGAGVGVESHGITTPLSQSMMSLSHLPSCATHLK